MTCVTIDNDGMCLEMPVRFSKQGIMSGKKKLHMHYFVKEHSLAIMSVADIRSLQVPNVKLFHFSLPAPLNTYIYPENIFIVKIVNDKPASLTAHEFVLFCEDLQNKSAHVEVSDAVYDVPAVPLTCDVEDHNVESDVEESELDEDDDELEEETDEEDWDIDDDDVVSAI